MAGALTTPTRTSKDIGGVRNAEVHISLACLSDDTNGLVPNQTLTGLGDHVLKDVSPVPDATAPFTAAYEVKIVDENGATIFLSGSIAVDSKAPIGGEATLGWYPRMGSSATFSLVDPSDHTSTINVGNEKEVVLNFLFEKKWS